MKRIPLIIPAYQPDENLIDLLKTLSDPDMGSVILVDDGSCSDCGPIFEKATELLGEDLIVLSHPTNRGKGAALKTAFQYVIENMKDVIGVVTADADGQHDAEDISSVGRALAAHPDKLILGVRDFESENIPLRSRYGNAMTRRITRYLSGLDISDTQTGLRGIPFHMLDELTLIRYDRYEYEMKALLQVTAGDGSRIAEVPIKTIYEPREERLTHFRPIIDSMRIYRILGGQLGKFFLSSLSSAVLDLVLFQLFCILFRDAFFFYVALSTIIARVLSATYNYLMNHKIVFRSQNEIKRTAAGYLALAAIQMSLSALLVTLLVFSFKGVPEFVFKIIVDTILFFISYKIQQKYIF